MEWAFGECSPMADLSGAVLRAPTLRAAQEQDVDVLHQLIESAYRGDTARQGWTHEADLLSDTRTDRDELIQVIRDPKRVILLAHQTYGELIGCVQVRQGVCVGACNDIVSDNVG